MKTKTKVMIASFAVGAAAGAVVYMKRKEIKEALSNMYKNMNTEYNSIHVASFDENGKIEEDEKPESIFMDVDDEEDDGDEDKIIHDVEIQQF